jgi:hypothetical protein
MFQSRAQYGSSRSKEMDGLEQWAYITFCQQLGKSMTESQKMIWLWKGEQIMFSSNA